MRLLAPALALALAGCGDPGLKAEGEACVATSECAAGLTCDLGASPPRCRPGQTRPPDASVIDAAPEDDAAQPVDAPPSIDAAQPIDAPPPIDAEPPVDVVESDPDPP